MCKQMWTTLHVLWSLVYVCTGSVQIVTGIFFVISLPAFKLGSNIGAGSWNVVAGIAGGMVACFMRRTARRQATLLYLAVTVLAVSVVNALLTEWRFLVTVDTAQNEEADDDEDMYRLIYYGRLTTGICSAALIITSFLDSQLSYCSMEAAKLRSEKRKNKGSHEQVSDIEYIIPRPKTNSVPKQQGSKSGGSSVYNAYAQSWVFEADAAPSLDPNHYETSPYLKMNDGNGSTLGKRSSIGSTGKHAFLKCDLTNGSVRCLDETMVISNPVVHIEEASDDSNGNTTNRKINNMKSFSRTPSPNILSASSSQSSLAHSSAPRIYECLERLTEPVTYRSRLNTAVSERDRLTPSPVPSHIDRPPVGEKVQYASLMLELEQQFISKKKDKFSTTNNKSPPSTSESLSDRTNGSSRQDSSRTDAKSSDAEFSKELEAALQLIQDLESPNTIDTPSEPCRSSEGRVGGSKVVAVWRHSDASESEKTLSAVGSLAELTSPMTECVVAVDKTPTLVHGKRTSVVVLCSDSQSTSGYSSPTHNIKGWSNSPSVNGSSSDLGRAMACSITNTKTSAVISLFSSPQQENKELKRRSVTLVNLNGNKQDTEMRQMNAFSAPCSNTGTVDTRERNNIFTIEGERAKTIDRIDLKSSKDEKCNLDRRPSLGTTANAVWNVKSLLRKKKAMMPKLPPDLEGAIFKSESLAHLSDVELLARHERNKEIQRQIEQRVQQQLGIPPAESHC